MAFRFEEITPRNVARTIILPTRTNSESIASPVENSKMFGINQQMGILRRNTVSPWFKISFIELIFRLPDFAVSYNAWIALVLPKTARPLVILFDIDSVLKNAWYNGSANTKVSSPEIKVPPD
jgi:hypothetical protein